LLQNGEHMRFADGRLCHGKRFAHELTGAHGLSIMASYLKPFGARVHLSGFGGDRWLNDLSRNGRPIMGEKHCFVSERHPQGISPCYFPPNLSAIFPWDNFFSCSQDAATTCEFATGTYGMEARYPLLDTRVVQEYLWLTSDVKNSEYKRPMADFMRRHEYPFDSAAPKQGFRVGRLERKPGRAYSYASKSLIEDGGEWTIENSRPLKAMHQTEEEQKGQRETHSTCNATVDHRAQQHTPSASQYPLSGAQRAAAKSSATIPARFVSRPHSGPHSASQAGGHYSRG